MLTEQTKAAIIGFLSRSSGWDPVTLSFWTDALGSAFLQFSEYKSIWVIFGVDLRVILGFLCLLCQWLLVSVLKYTAVVIATSPDLQSVRTCYCLFMWLKMLYMFTLLVIGIIMVGFRYVLIFLSVVTAVKRYFIFSVVFSTIVFINFVLDEWTTSRSERYFYDPYAWLPQSFSLPSIFPKVY
jgi:hypothetical protein